MIHLKKKYGYYEYLENFGKKYYLFGKFKFYGRVITLPLYHGSLRSILKYTTYKDVERNLGIINEDVFKIVLRKNLLENEDLYLDFMLSEASFFMASNKDARGKTNLRFCDSRDVLFCTSDDLFFVIMKEIKPKMSPDERKSFASFICKLIDEDYKEKLSLPRSSHNRTTSLDIVRQVAGRLSNFSNLSNLTFEQLILEHDVLKTTLEIICKDFEKKEKLIKEIYKLTGKRQILSEQVMSERSYYLTRKLKKDLESRKYVEKSIFDVLFKNGLIKQKQTTYKDDKTDLTFDYKDDEDDFDDFLGA